MTTFTKREVLAGAKLPGLRDGHATAWMFRQLRPEGKLGTPALIWGSGIGEIDGPKVDDPAFAEIVLDQPFALNNLADEGETDMLDVYFDAQAVRTTLYGRLTNTTLAEASTETTVNTSEASGNGYTAVTYTRNTDWTAASSVATGAQKTFSASGGSWGPVTDFALTTSTTTTGLLIAYVALSASRTLQDGDSLTVDATVTMS